MAKLYESKKWMEMQLYTLKQSPVEIAKKCDVEPMTIYRWITKHGLRK